MASMAPQPLISRRYGRSLLSCAPTPMTFLSHKEIGKVDVDCRLRLSKSKWGVIGKNENPGGIIYLDLNFDQPADCKLSSASVSVTLEEHRVFEENSLFATDQFGPKRLTGELYEVPVTKNYRFTPHVDVLGAGAGGIGIDTSKRKVLSSRWSFTGQLLFAEDKDDATREKVYRRLKWELTENKLESRVLHSNLFHAGFTIEHERQPFYLKIEIEGKLRRTKDRIMNRLKFPPNSQKKDGVSWTLIDPGVPGKSNRSLDALADGLSKAMEMENLQDIPMQMPEALPVSFTEPVHTSILKKPSYLPLNGLASGGTEQLSGRPIRTAEQLLSSLPASQPLNDLSASYLNSRNPNFYNSQTVQSIESSRNGSEAGLSTTHNVEGTSNSSIYSTQSISTACSGPPSTTSKNDTSIEDTGDVKVQEDDLQELLSRLSKSVPTLCWSILMILQFIDWLQRIPKALKVQSQLPVTDRVLKEEGENGRLDLQRRRRLRTNTEDIGGRSTT
ncbi:2-amino-3-carboxymuconate-6-semialdehyde decarboxylase protein [Rutstroemia sp. NJR-2017a BVV2]|nr:2-amino-3-carboxymuconate-6-semialdehyde decarboxylase protein [Rutstroemia sp. NJR-2017a BVV2]PQE09437.1 2-amino-3-carboxymuconate-6-semialdehyde decarboxylase protein [Rutstroemia sp. NJR-2017a BVV2]